MSRVVDFAASAEGSSMSHNPDTAPHQVAQHNQADVLPGSVVDEPGRTSVSTTPAVDGFNEGEDRPTHETPAKKDSATVVITQPPGATNEAQDLASIKPNKTDGTGVEVERVLRGDYVETFAIGGGTKWLYATIEFITALFVVLKDVGVPFGAQLVLLWHSIVEMDIVGPLLKAALGASSRISYKVTGAYEAMHPPLDTFWKKGKDTSLCSLCGFNPPCKSLRWPADEAPEQFPFPWRVGGLRGTPEHRPFTDFENAIMANERGWWLGLVMHGNKRGFRLRFKTGKQANGGTSLFWVRRQGRSPLALCPVIGCLFNDNGAASRGLKVCAEDGKTIIGRVLPSKQGSACGSLFANRFTRRAQPLYDVVDANDAVLFTVHIPVEEYKFLGCIKAYAQMKHLAIVRGPLPPGDRFGGATDPDSGWIIPLEPKYAACIESCLSACDGVRRVFQCITFGVFELIERVFRLFEAFIGLIRTCPIDDWTQVPHPGRSELRMTTPCSHAMTASRTRFPKNITEEEHMLLIAAGIAVDMEDVFTYL
ncbi:hypothetical protein PTSG_06560 [Salpingoeca rosetta]|uniref:Uncharacterized protein n=1 Tax=Salpingoeca rosetta (strain ATCC 50818 / BSB-021) TaxID=946362 RepID=F2UG58_SALR5|nr:uncharacterized protein PTSG_06560 [Salpingoeca rosetta]EGD75486.1 hypothetical protein PTSG_06560 [Salpingoeca rosetta]|eukprot:XP_004991943.1 hypothetical protein PTSG_06560 [Salpingoeca rosetta]